MKDEFCKKCGHELEVAKTNEFDPQTGKEKQGCINQKCLFGCLNTGGHNYEHIKEDF